ncbi:hypothetical protein ACFV4P_20905 [Kitasatospora sp. NPDC059795]|uniref:hypothetical protein n=1 Tax=Kitasatospora sp. NPDC059795 TaxID=3346949 RepID=UPI0036508620
MLQYDDVRSEVLSRLQNKAKSRAWDGEFLDIVDTALDLALSQNRRADNADHLTRNVMRDARGTIIRAKRNACRSAAARPLPDAARRRVTTLGSDGSVTAEMVTHDTPEARVLVTETLRELTAFALTLGPYGPGCLQDMLGQETVPVSAQRRGVSIATVERARRSLREQTRVLLEDAA